MKLRRIGIQLTPNTRDSNKLYISIVTSVDDFPVTTTFQDLLNFFNEGILKNVDWSDKVLVSIGYEIDNGKLNIKHPEINDAKTELPADLVYIRVVEGVGLLINMYVRETINFKKNIRNEAMIDYNLALNATSILTNKNQATQAIDNYLVREQHTTLGRLWVKYYEGTESEDIKKQKLITKLFNKL